MAVQTAWLNDYVFLYWYLKIEKKFKKTKQIYVRKITHVLISILLIIIILIFKYIIANEV